jgi:enterochelin esterase-like enzyme
MTGRIASVVWLGCVLSGTATFCAPPAQSTSGAPAWVDPDRTEPAGTRYRTFHSEIAHRDVSYLVYLPPAYEDAGKNHYPVIYWLHGLGGDQRSGAPYVRMLDAAIKANQAPAMIVILVNGMRSSFYTDSADGRLPVESVILKDLIPHVDSTYRTIARREGRVVEGASMGAYGALHLGLKYPKTFGVISSIMAGVQDENRIADMYPAIFQTVFSGDKNYFRANSPWTLAQENAEAIRGSTFLRLWIGGKDAEWRRESNAKFHELLERQKIVHQFETIPGVSHTFRPLYEKMGDKNWAFYREALPEAQ